METLAGNKGEFLVKKDLRLLFYKLFRSQMRYSGNGVVNASFLQSYPNLSNIEVVTNILVRMQKSNGITNFIKKNFICNEGGV